MNIDRLFSQGLEYENAGQVKLAADCYHKILEVDPKHVPSLTRLGIQALNRGDSREAGVMIKWARKLAPDDPDVASAWNALRGASAAPTTPDPTAFQATPQIPDNSPLNILFLQNSPCIRNYKMATALRAKGHRVSLGYTIKLLSQRYPGLSDDTYDENICIRSYRQLWDMSKNFDLIHSHNEPDELTVAALAGDCPVIHDTHDLISLRANNDPGLAYFEGIANRGAHGRIATTPFQEREIMNMYGPKNPGLVFYNYASQADLPRIFHPKLSARDGQVHFVYEGGLSESAHRDFRDIFVEMAVRGMHVHIYPASWSDKLAAFFSRHKRIRYNKPVSPKVLMEEMTRYDIGIIPWNLEKGNKRFLDSTIANKLFEYLAAGLPVATSRLQSYEDFFERTPVGVTFDSVQELVETHVPRLLEMAKTIDFSRHVYTFESEIQRVEEFYRHVLENGNRQTAIAVKKASDCWPGKGQRKQEAAIFRSDSSVRQVCDPAIQHAFDRFSRWLIDYGWDGYDPYDIEDFIMNLESQGQKISSGEKKTIRAAGKEDPMGVRKKLNIPRKRIAKGLGLLTTGWARLYKVTGKDEYLREASKLAQWLMDNPSQGYANLCWGYPFDWQSVIFIPKHTPSAVVSTVVGDGLWELFSITRDEKYLEACASICRFITNDLNRDDMGNGGLCFSYTPIDDYHVHNANLFCGEFLARIGKELNNPEWLDLASRIADYAMAEQNPDGSIFYWGRVQNQNNPDHLDHYHTGFEIRCLFKLYQYLNSEKIRNCYERYLDFYQRNFLDPSGLPKQNPKKSLPVNIHGAAECILLNSMLSPEHKKCLETADRALKWTIKHMQTKEGWFAHLWSPNKRVEAPYLRWGQAWMLRAWSEYYSTKHPSQKKNCKKNQVKKVKPKVCHVGGAHSVHVADVVKELHRKGYEQCVISYFPVEKSITIPEVPVYHFPYRDYTKPEWNKYGMEERLLKFIDAVIDSENPDIAHGHSLTYSCIPLSLIRNRYHIPIIVSPWNTNTIDYPDPIANYYEKKCLEYTEYVLEGLHSRFKKFQSYYGNLKDEQFVLFKYLVDLSIYDKNPRKIISTPSILSARVMSASYRQDLLIKALPKLIRCYPNLKVTLLIGQSPEQGRPFFKKMYRLAEDMNVMNNCRFVDRSLNMNEFSTLINKHAIIYTSATHGSVFSATNLQAMYSGGIAISQENEDLDILMHGENYLQTKMNEEDVLCTLLYAVDNISLLQKKFIKNNRFLKMYDKEHMLKNLIECYKKL